LRELDPETIRNMATPTLKRETCGLRKSGTTGYQFAGFGTKIAFSFIVRSTCYIADLEGDDARISASRSAVASTLRNSPKAARGGACVFGVARLRKDSSRKKPAYPSVLAENIPVARLKSS
jgi:hypothetical protein